MSEVVEDYHQFSLDQWLDWLANRHADEIQLGLNRIRQVYQRLNLPKPATQVITVAGTNGKGSVVYLLEAIYQKAGYQVGAYISPHLDRFNERIRVNQTLISDKALCELFSWIESNRGATYLTYFEMVTLAALVYFSQHPLDVVILEVGLGGRLDAVNIIDTDCAVITTVDYDHQAYLGTTIEAIAAEKAGIIRPEKPTVFGDYALPDAIQRQVNQLGSPLYQLGNQFDFQRIDSSIQCQVNGKTYSLISDVHPQACVTAMMVVTLMNDTLTVLDNDLRLAFKHCYVPGRLQWIHHQPKWLLDVAHNVQAVKRLTQVIQACEGLGTVRVVFAVFKDKAFGQMIELMAKLSQNWYIAPLANSRTASRLELMSEISHHKGTCLAFDSVERACEQASLDAEMNDLIVVFGSFVTVQMANCYLKKIGIN
jgi:dihydrofolate synthase/folylpolyglutamate synthase